MMSTERDRFVFVGIGLLWMLPAVLVLGCRVESPQAINSKVDNLPNETSIAESSDRESPQSDVTPEVVESKEPSSVTNTLTDEDYRKLILGTWQDDYQGKRTLTVREDGTATMVVQPKGLAATLFAERMIFEEKWRVEEGHLKLKAVGGEPQGRVNLVLKTMGDSADYQIIQLTQDRLLLKDSDGKTTYEWRRAGDE